MNYEQKYKEALERARECYRKSIEQGWTCDKEIYEQIFPELCESEDERIRKEIIQFLLLPHPQFVGKRNYEEWISWLKKQGEQKPIPKFKIGDTIHKIGENTVFPMTIEKVEDGYYVCNNSHSFVNIKFQDYFELVNQTPSWSEEDEKQIRQIERIVKDSGASTNLQKKISDWLKSLKDRVQPQPKQEWSEEDEEKLNSIIEVLGDNSLLVQWFKSLKPNHWKPSKEQLKALKQCIGGYYSEEADKKLELLYDELKKL